MKINFYPEQYQKTGVFPINHNYLPNQFSDYPDIFEKVAKVVRDGDFTLGSAVDQFEADFAKANGAKFGVGVGSGTDALFLSLKAIGIQPGGEVITTPFTFYATIGAIVTAGGTPKFVDIGPDHNINAQKIEAAITERTKAIMPVHWAGVPCDMDVINQIAKKHQVMVIADACHGILSEYKGDGIAAHADISCFSMHPLKNLNVWGDGGVVLSSHSNVVERLYSLRNHGLMDRDHCAEWGYNSRLDTVQAVVAQHLLEHKIKHITEMRMHNAQWLDAELSDIPQIQMPTRHQGKKSVFHLYMGKFDQRDALKAWLNDKGIDAKVHYPTPMHLQPAAKQWNYQRGDFPEAEHLANNCLSLPVHEFIGEADLQFMCDAIKEFYENAS